ncbi:3-keto-5-aminohexanoate cleavage protein [Sinirhodobacter sp. WL0062]|uniref:3-keto-5-aminohexanoate cleavage protein n=1 Tax=Rhodobacter flavimaris TaxID=2907145 RepID=A0ABS8YVH9_9RHOB|nr:3-keto-5-aminohexanoate cleavage protein [Sinirhodobacter sp. WL0062]MCE5972514.1 3-keto-5-aminohexanoate cleavage protein [Sinirhodobacter sp. WL0062]
MRSLPRIMVAPNGARLTKADHPGIPVTIPEIVDCAVACHKVGADGIHAHVRDAAGAHVLDAGLYRELLAELGLVLPGFYTQITTEAVGRYTAAEQRELVHAVRPAAVSVALREITDGAEPAETTRFFAFCHEAGIEVQHILYDVADIERLAQMVDQGAVPRADLRALIVLGRYSAGQKSAPSDLDAPAAALLRLLPETDWAVCAFGAQETACLLAAAEWGGKARIGFENNRLNADLSVATTNAERVADLVAALEASGLN